ncbi:MAG: type IX secretion system membrane protein PorP/SprF [Chlorobi bacterium]|nr:type IX secretion system membrane protein PorP/SprF [Chlorobiota bacterium]
MKQKIIYILFLFIGLILITDVYGQQAPIFTQYYNTYMFSNPAYAGMRRGICVNGVYRQQWAGGFNDEDGYNMAPQDILLSLDSPLKVLHGGIGGSVIQDRLGYQSDIIVQVDYSFHLNLSIGVLGLGAGLNIINRSIDGSKFKPVEDGDPILPTSSVSDLRLDASGGLFLNQEGRYYVGVSVANILESGFKKLDPSGNSITSTDRTFYVVGGYYFTIPRNPMFEIIPSFMILSNLASTQYNLTGIVKYNDKFWGGVNYRFQESIGFIAGVRFKSFKISYSYDLNTLPVSIPGSHEVSLSYCFKIKAEHYKTSYKNTRYL